MLKKYFSGSVVLLKKMPSAREGTCTHTYINFVWEGRGGAALKSFAEGWHLFTQIPVLKKGAQNGPTMLVDASNAICKKGTNFIHRVRDFSHFTNYCSDGAGPLVQFILAVLLGLCI